MIREKTEIKNSSLFLTKYEELRAQALAHSRLDNNLAPAAFVHRGMATWTKALNSSEPIIKPTFTKEINKIKFIPEQVQTDFINSIANIVLNLQQGVLA